ncbi:MAG: carboxypeptidase-like regulatory domain-containing protein [Candidatus Omnitrophota bacterium]
MRNIKTIWFVVLYMAFTTLVSAGPAPSTGTVKTLKFVEGEIQISNVSSHKRVSTDFISGVFAGIAEPLLKKTMDSFFNVASNAPVSGYTTSPQGANTVSITTANSPTAENTGVVVFTTQVPSGSVSTGATQTSVSQQVIQAEKDKQKQQFAIPFQNVSVGAGFSIDTFWVPSQNNRFEADIKLTWSFTKDDLNNYNANIQSGYLKGASVSSTGQLQGGVVPLGSIKIETDRSRFCRQFGARMDLGVDLKWNNKWKNNVVGINVTDVAVEIDAVKKDGLGSEKIDYSDTVNVSDIPGVVIGLVEKISEKIGKEAGSAAAKEASDSLVEKIFDEMEIGVLATSTTYDRSLDISFAATAKTMSGETLNLEVIEPNLTFSTDGLERVINARLPQDCPPLKSVTLKVTSAKYHYKELSNVELGISANYIPVELRTGILTEDIGRYFEKEHAVAARDEDKPWFTVETTDQLVFIPFLGMVVTGDPAVGVSGAQVDLYYEGKKQKSTTTGPDGSFYDAFYRGQATNAKPKNMTVMPAEQNYPNWDVKFIDDKTGYKIKLIGKAENYIAVFGRVLDLQNNPIEGAEVHATTSQDAWVATNSQGQYSLPKVLKGNELTVSANKTGFNFLPIVKIVGQETVFPVDIKAQFEASHGKITLNFKKSGNIPVPARISVKRQNGAQFFTGLDRNNSVGIPVFEANETLTVSCDGFTLKPSVFKPQMDWNKYNQENKFEVVAIPLWSQSITLAVEPQTSIECCGSASGSPGPNEKATLVATVKNSTGEFMPNIPVRFEVVSSTGTAALKFSQTGLRSGCGYGTSDSNGKARVDISAYCGLGTVVIKAVATDRYIITGNNSDQLFSNTMTITVIPSTNVVQLEKPTAAVAVYTNSKAVDGRLIPTVEKGGEIIFHLSAVDNNIASPLKAISQFIGYKISFSKNNGAWQTTTYDTAFPGTFRKTFEEAGTYKIGFEVHLKSGDKDIWSLRTEKPFEVVQLTPPQVSLTLGSNQGAVNIPASFSFTATTSAPFKRITLTFGDNRGMDLDLDAGLLAGKLTWTGSHYHIYNVQGTYTLTLRAVDQNDRVAETTKTITIGSIASLNDHIAPTGSLTINDGAQSTVDKGVSLHINGNDNSGGSGVYRMRVSNDGSTWSIWYSAAFGDDQPHPSVSRDFAWQLSDGAGAKTVYLQLKDAADNLSANITATIQLQAAGIGTTSGNLPAPAVIDTNYTNPPAPSGSITIAGRTGNNLSVNFSAFSPWAIAVNQMALSFDGVNWTSWMQMESNKQISLEGNLAATKLYVTYGDRAGGQSPVYSANIPAAVAVAQTTAATPTSAATTTPSTTGGGSQPAGGGQGTGSAIRANLDKEIARERENRSAARRNTVASITTAVEPKPIDLEIVDIRLPREIIVEKKCDLEIIVKNNSDREAKEVVLNFETEDGFKDRKPFNLRAQGQERIKFSWTPRKDKRQRINASLDHQEDQNPRNNTQSQMVQVTAARNSETDHPVIFESGAARERIKSGELRKRLKEVEEKVGLEER